MRKRVTVKLQCKFYLKRPFREGHFALHDLGHLDFLGLLGSFLIAGRWDCSGPQVCEIGDWKISRRLSVKISWSHHEVQSPKWEN